jgi:hypothetical protein
MHVRDLDYCIGEKFVEENVSSGKNFPRGKISSGKNFVTKPKFRRLFPMKNLKISLFSSTNIFPRRNVSPRIFFKILSFAEKCKYLKKYVRIGKYHIGEKYSSGKISSGKNIRPVITFVGEKRSSGRISSPSQNIATFPRRIFPR